MPNTAHNRAVVHVAAGVIIRDARVLVTRRPDDTHQGGLWEFPGGKLEPAEEVEAALKRELHEEIGIVVLDASALLQVHHDYGDKRVLLDFWQIEAFEGEPVGREGQALQWCPLVDLPKLEFPAANIAVVEHLRECL